MLEYGSAEAIAGLQLIPCRQPVPSLQLPQHPRQPLSLHMHRWPSCWNCFLLSHNGNSPVIHMLNALNCSPVYALTDVMTKIHSDAHPCSVKQHFQVLY